MKVKVNNSLVIIGAIISLIFATILGIYGQDISYYLNNRYPTIELKTVITIVTFLSIALYIVTPVLVLKILKLKGVYLLACITVFTLIGLPISLFSFFVWAMWMG
ncbi:hypothetical protein QTL97_11375 [Sporosarcina thermotolerans]|uniref:Major facilitator superfamily (MFS) profile domain-containing protein n=1 Tax=Sporosarcina thermotolerans TaxID=633404 RepID=A0AAW9A908_9BACL|nr:hypothetical protein [Sporosarcina thermotolerans]MDW0117539.1 hypothetical protein [Sporosarcina thermotolerans]WHT49701.1 hypothetical protein QNH10_09530 [Sporosarcina thermotolerans]